MNTQHETVFRITTIRDYPNDSVASQNSQAASGGLTEELAPAWLPGVLASLLHSTSLHYTSIAWDRIGHNITTQQLGESSPLQPLPICVRFYYFFVIPMFIIYIFVTNIWQKPSQLAAAAGETNGCGS